MRTPPPPATSRVRPRRGTLRRLPPPGVTQLLERFHALDSSGDGLLEQAEFVAALGLEAAPAGYATRLFSFFGPRRLRLEPRGPSPRESP